MQRLARTKKDLWIFNLLKAVSWVTRNAKAIRGSLSSESVEEASLPVMQIALPIVMTLMRLLMMMFVKIVEMDVYLMRLINGQLMPEWT